MPFWCSPNDDHTQMVNDMYADDLPLRKVRLPRSGRAASTFSMCWHRPVRHPIGVERRLAAWFVPCGNISIGTSGTTGRPKGLSADPQPSSARSAVTRPASLRSRKNERLLVFLPGWRTSCPASLSMTAFTKR